MDKLISSLVFFFLRSLHEKTRPNRFDRIYKINDDTHCR